MTPQVQLQRVHMGTSAPTEAVTRETVREMCQHIIRDINDPVVRSVASKITPGIEALTKLWLWIKSHVQFVHDDVQIAQLLGEQGHFELLISPAVLLRMPQPKGDCDDFTMLVCALAGCLGYQCRIVTLVCDRKRPGEYSHVFATVSADGENWFPMDTSHGTYPGWQVPQRDVQRRTEWDMQGNQVFDRTYFTLMPQSQGYQGMGATDAQQTAFDVMKTLTSGPYLMIGAPAAVGLMVDRGKGAVIGGLIGAAFYYLVLPRLTSLNPSMGVPYSL